MSYEKQNFVDGQVLEAEHLNHIEAGLKALEESGGAVVIVDCVSLPTENVSENAFYRQVSGTFIQNQTTVPTYVCQCVDSLPEVGELMVDENQTRVLIYYNRSDGLIYGYMDDTLASAQGAPGAGWYDVSLMLGSDWGGVITSKDDDPNDGKLRLLLSFKIYHHKGGSWTSLDPMSVGWSGEGTGAEVFNYQGNTASGNYAHAEGGQTTASADYAHAEGYQTEAIGTASHSEGQVTEAVGEYSHAEGYGTHALGECSHAEGYINSAEGAYSHTEGTTTQAFGAASHAEGGNTQALGEYAHSEGYGTKAEGENSHAEGYMTTAVGWCQHVHGSRNVKDEVVYDDGTERSNYITIVGNGISTRSNAHTLDWDGNAWFAGSVEGTAIILSSPNGTRFKVTVSDSGALTVTEITE